jgi:NAD(P) transhydrogenase subunit alpha
VLPGVLLAALGMLVLAAGCQRAVPPASASAADESSPGSAATPDHDSHGAPKAGTSGDVRGQADRIQARQTLMVSITIFVLSIFVGVELITKVPATLHTPLMSGSNAISGITVVGAVIAAGSAGSGVGAFVASAIGLIAVILATINVVGGFLVTHRMLRMFDRR